LLDEGRQRQDRQPGEEQREEQVDEQHRDPEQNSQVTEPLVPGLERRGERHTEEDEDDDVEELVEEPRSCHHRQAEPEDRGPLAQLERTVLGRRDGHEAAPGWSRANTDAAYCACGRSESLCLAVGRGSALALE